MTIINFHGIGSPDTTIDDGEKPYWVSENMYREIISRAAAHPRRKDIRITFDDGNQSDLEIAAPLLVQYDLKGSFYILTGRFEKTAYLSTSDCRKLIEMGMSIGLHGRDHVDWRNINTEQLHSETITARQELSKATGSSIDSVAIPFGAYNRKIINHLRQQGFKRVYTSDGGQSRDGFIRPRTSIQASMSMTDIDAILDGSEALKPRLRRAISTFLRRNIV